MHKQIAGLAFCIAAFAVSAAAQTVTGSGTSGTVPVFNGTSTVTNSPISVSGSNVGIGTTNPLVALDIHSTNTDILIDPQNAAISGYYPPNPSGGELDLYGSNEWGGRIRLGGSGRGDSSQSVVQFIVNGNEYMRVDGGFPGHTPGNVGIGTTSPAYSLDVVGPIRTSSTSTATGGIIFPDGSTQMTAYTQIASGNNQITQANGNVGIGTTVPGVKLQVHGQSMFGMGLSAFGQNANTILIDQPGYWQASLNIWQEGIASGLLGSRPGDTNLYLTNDYIGAGLGTASESLTLTTSGNVGIGMTAPGAKLEVNGNVKLTSGSGASIIFQDGSIQNVAYTGVTCGGDYAESVDVTGNRKNYEPGDVLVIGAESGSDVAKSSEPYSTLVVGVYSTKPGVVGRRQTTDAKPSKTEVPMAMVGIVPTKVSAENGPIKRGDLLVTASTIGYAMKGMDRNRMLGAVIGKALGNLNSGKGVIEVVVTLQ